jgi:lysophospholipase L1-like esterase
MLRNKPSIVFVIVLLGYSVIVLGGCAKGGVKNIDSRGKNIVCLGDSLTVGIGAVGGQDYPTLLAKLLNKHMGPVQAPRVINAGKSGDTTLDALGRLKSDCLDKDPLMVIIILGGNDLLKNFSIGQTLKNLEKILNKTQEAGAIAVLACPSTSKIMPGWEPAYERLTRAKGALFIPGLFEGLLDNPDFKSDYVHLNEAGYRIVAERILRAITPLIQENLESR